MNTYTDIEEIRKNLAYELSELSRKTRTLAFVISAITILDVVAIIIVNHISPRIIIVSSIVVTVGNIGAFVLIYREVIHEVFRLTTAVIIDALRIRLSPRESARETLEDQRTATYKAYEKIAKLLGVQASWIA